MEKHLPNMQLYRGGAIGDVFNDHITQVELKNVEGKAREVLTQAVPLKGYTRFLWRAKSKRLADGKWSIQLMYFGPKEVDDEVK